MRLPRLQLLGLALCLACLQVSLEGRELRVASYNLRNYLCMDRLVDGRFRRDYPKPEAEKRVVRETIRSVSPDLLAVQEIGSLALLEELRDDLAREGLFYEGLFVLEAEDDVRKVGALWKSELSVEPAEHASLGFTFFGRPKEVKRGMLELRVEDPSAPFSVFVLHLKSKYTDDERDHQSSVRRTREAQAARERILDLYPDPSQSRFMVVGDLNDGPNSSAVRRFLARGELTIAEPLDLRDSHGLEWTHYFVKDASYSRIDYMLFSPALLRASGPTGAIVSRPDYYEGSDHRLIWADLTFPSAD